MGDAVDCFIWWCTDDSVTAICDDVMLLSVIFLMLGVINNVLSNGTHINDNNTTAPSYYSSLLTAAAVTVAYPLVQHK